MGTARLSSEAWEMKKRHALCALPFFIIFNNMKRYSLKSQLLIILLAVIITSCSDEYVEPHTSDAIINPGFVRFDEPVIPIIDPSNPTSGAFTNKLIDPGNSVASFEIFATLVTSDSTYLRRSIKVIDEFPHDLSISFQDVIDAFNGGITAEDISFGDELFITSEATDQAGNRYTTEDFSQDLLKEGQRQAFDYRLLFTCLFNLEDALGEYLIVLDPFNASLDYDRPIEAVAGPDGNSIIFLDLFSNPEKYDVEVTIDDIYTGEATIDRQLSWNCENYGCSFGLFDILGTGNVYSCEGRVELFVTYTTSRTSFGFYPLHLEKIE